MGDVPLHRRAVDVPVLRSAAKTLPSVVVDVLRRRVRVAARRRVRVRLRGRVNRCARGADVVAQGIVQERNSAVIADMSAPLNVPPIECAIDDAVRTWIVVPRVVTSALGSVDGDGC